MQAQITSRLALVAGLAQRLEFRGLRTVFDKRRTVIHIRNCLRYPKKINRSRLVFFARSPSVGTVSGLGLLSTQCHHRNVVRRARLAVGRVQGIQVWACPNFCVNGSDFN